MLDFDLLRRGQAQLRIEGMRKLRRRVCEREGIQAGDANQCRFGKRTREDVRTHGRVRGARQLRTIARRRAPKKYNIHSRRKQHAKTDQARHHQEPRRPAQHALHLAATHRRPTHHRVPPTPQAVLLLLHVPIKTHRLPTPTHRPVPPKRHIHVRRRRLRQDHDDGPLL